MGYAPRALLAGGLGFAMAFIVACGGGSGLLSADQANNLNSQLDQVANAVDSGQCNAAADAVTTFSNSVVNLPPSVSPTLTRNLKQGASTIQQLAAKDCRSTTSSTTTSSTTSSSTSTSSTPSTTTTTSTSTSTSTSTPTSTSTSTATTPTGSGTTSTTGGSGGAALGGGGTSGTGGSGTGSGGNAQ